MRTTRFRPVDVAQEFHRSADWLRALERGGIIPPARRDFRGWRYYEPGDVAEIRRIILKQDGAPEALASA